ncbi:M24 family metallopeptidase [Chloroflexota bacterium]
MGGEFGLKLGPEPADYTEGIINFARMRQERAAKAQAAMKKNGLAAVLLLRAENIRYVAATKYPYYMPKHLRYTLALSEHEPILYEPAGNPVGECPWVKPENRRLALHWADQCPGREATWDMAKRFAAGIKRDLEQKGLGKEKLGFDELNEPARQALTEAGIRLVNALPVMLEARATKTQDEINCFRKVAAIADRAHYALYQAMKPGIRERDLAAVGSKAVLESGAELPGAVHIGSGGYIGGRSISSDRIIQPGDVVTIDIVSATYMGYHTCYYRNYIVGRKPTDKEKEMHKKSYERVYKVIDAIKPGATTADVAKYWVTAKETGFPSEEYVWLEDLGHGLGLSSYEYPIINRLWSFDYPQTFETGMTMAIEAMDWDPMIGRTKLEEMVVVTDTGVEIFTKMPVKDIMIANPIIVAE